MGCEFEDFSRELKVDGEAVGIVVEADGQALNQTREDRDKSMSFHRFFLSALSGVWARSLATAEQFFALTVAVHGLAIFAELWEREF